MTPQGKAIRLATHIDIPLEIGLPNFIRDDNLSDEGPLFGNFKLVLQSVVCHRGTSVNSGHYVSIVRNEIRQEDLAPDGESEGWLMFDDLADPRVKSIDIDTALGQESPYLLFYQVVPIEESQPSPIVDPPLLLIEGQSDSGISGLASTVPEAFSAEYSPSVPSRRQSTVSIEEPTTTSTQKSSLEIAPVEGLAVRTPELEETPSSVRFSPVMGPTTDEPVIRPSRMSRIGFSSSRAGSRSRNNSQQRSSTDGPSKSEPVKLSTVAATMMLPIRLAEGELGEKKRNRLSHHLGKSRDKLAGKQPAQPDRECLVM
jgi:hypothetical protein